MDEDSFDPKQWVAGNGRHSPPPVQKQESGEGIGAFWREVAEPQHTAPNAAPSHTTHTDTGHKSTAQRPAPHRRLAFAIAGSVLVLGAGAISAWLTAVDPIIAPSASPSAASAAPSNAQERAINLAGPGQLAGALIEAGVRADDASAAAAAAAPHLASVGEIHAIIVLLPGEGGALLQQLRAVHINGSGVILARAADGTFSVTPLAADVSRKIEVLRGEIDSESFYTSAVSAGLIDTLIPDFINAFSYDFNLASEVSPGDVFEVAYDQEVNADGEPVGQPKLLYAQLTTPKKSLALYRFQPPGEDAGWFDGNGATTKRGLMRTPVDGARITSKFGMRFHPVLHYNKLHGGTDFAAPTGTPIYAAADGTIEFAAMKGANGNLTILRHDNGWQTYYLHQNVFAPGIAAGVRVTQGQRIGDVGTTGRSTGPHLHYEVHIDGERVDPLSIPVDEASRKRMEGTALQAFLKERDRIDMARSQRTL
ncbi:M23 family metallopeptidase [Novosphingobium sp. ERN07]|uniref:M23 family metallopeptidase n=1 Tax=Novosphingobium sp. ERN07 TaxID=2726187 RepID=UPI00145680FA|nr:M23 family metallopeptidase [Novosphingobium sp. ERN07]NLR72724.1 M23 family metallopeptidase [Novosphingobium sp. ERN07]